MNAQFLTSLFGGVLIGLSVTWMLLFNGRIAGISGILSGSLGKPSKSQAWRYWFLAGLFLGGLTLAALAPESLTNSTDRSFYELIIAGLLVGFGTVIGGGCTSGHGICGVSRLSPRSIVATLSFMIMGLLMANLIYYVRGAL